MYTSQYPRSLSEKEYQAILKVHRAGKLIDFKAIKQQMEQNRKNSRLHDPIFEIIYRHYS